MIPNGTRNHPKDGAKSAKSHLKGMQKVFLTGRLRKSPEGNAGFGHGGMIGRGYRNDGSYRHKPEIEAYLRDSIYIDGNLTEKLHDHSVPFTAPFLYSEDKAKRILETLQRFKDLDIELLLYIPPYSNIFFEEAMKDKLFASFWKDYMAFQQMLIDRGYDLIPFCTPTQIGLTDDYMVGCRTSWRSALCNPITQLRAKWQGQRGNNK